MEPLRNVALLALLYRQAYLNRWESIDSIATDQDVCPGELSWLSMLAAKLPARDWQILATLAGPTGFESTARRLDPLRAEALLHAAPPKGVYPTGRWGESYRARWGEVCSRMRLFEGQGYTATSDDLEAIAAQAWMAATGDTLAQYANAWA